MCRRFGFVTTWMDVSLIGFFGLASTCSILKLFISWKTWKKQTFHEIRTMGINLVTGCNNWDDHPSAEEINIYIYIRYIHIWYHIYLILNKCIRQCWLSQQEPFFANELPVCGWKPSSCQTLNEFMGEHWVDHWFISLTTRNPSFDSFFASTCHPWLPGFLVEFLDDHRFPNGERCYYQLLSLKKCFFIKTMLTFRIASPPRLFLL